MTKKLVVLVFLTLMLAGCSLISKESPVTIIEPQELKEKLNNKESFILVIGNKEKCGPCETHINEGIRKLYKKQEYKSLYLNVDTVSKQKDMDILIEILYEHLSEDPNQSLGVPSTYLVNQGLLVIKESGLVPYETLETHYEKHLK